MEVTIIKIAESKAVVLLAERISLSCGLGLQKTNQVKIAAALHDCGKECISKEILDKPGKLTKSEFEVVKTHTKHGFRMLSDMHCEAGEAAKITALYHHEHFDGRGYWGVPLNTLPRYVSIVAISDVFCALLSKRVYKEPWPPNDALKYIKEKAGTQFCPDLTNALIKLLRKDCVASAVFMGCKPFKN